MRFGDRHVGDEVVICCWNEKIQFILTHRSRSARVELQYTAGSLSAGRRFKYPRPPNLEVNLY